MGSTRTPGRQATSQRRLLSRNCRLGPSRDRERPLAADRVLLFPLPRVIAALYLDFNTDVVALSRARHGAVTARLQTNLVTPRLVGSRVADLLEKYRKFREFANYAVGGKLPGDEEYINAAADARQMYHETGQAMSSLLDFIRAVSNASHTSPTVSEKIMIAIGDDFSEDVYNMLLVDRR
jgi:hypothetical protein